jgi:CheY-like chemotaxis protein
MEPPSKYESESGRAPHRVLIVDDDAESADSLAMLLQAPGNRETRETRVAYSAGAAVALAVEFQPTIVFLDVGLPDMGGYEVARRLHQHPHLQNRRLIALTDSGEHPGRERAREAGFERYLLKPVTAVALEELLSMSQ